VVDFDRIGRAVTAAGYKGAVEVEIFNADIWASEPDEVVATVKARWAALVAPSLTSSAPLGTR
jgi:sugar phosphate isomerase/epimerase